MTMKDREQSMRGKLKIEFSEGKGAKFLFSIPVV